MKTKIKTLFLTGAALSCRRARRFCGQRQSLLRGRKIRRPSKARSRKSAKRARRAAAFWKFRGIKNKSKRKSAVRPTSSTSKPPAFTTFGRARSGPTVAATRSRFRSTAASPKILGEDGTYDAWHWVGGKARVKLNAGVNTLVLSNRETGVKVDQFFLCEDTRLHARQNPSDHTVNGRTRSGSGHPAGLG